MLKGSQTRKPEHGVDTHFLDRWSPRALAPETLPKEELMRLFEAARWAPSSYNNQPWRFLYATRDGRHWDTFFNLLGDSNKAWCKNAAALVVVVSKTSFDYNGKPSRTHSFDAGSAWQNLALQATRSGLVAHGMEGFDYDRAKSELKIPEGFQVEAMIAIGKPGDPGELPEKVREMEKPNSRKSLQETVCEGPFGFQTAS